MISLRKEIVLALGLTVFSAAQAQIATQDCTGCSTAQVEAMAKICNVGYTYITDFASQNLYKVCYNIDVNDEYNPPRREKVYDWAVPESSYLQTFQAYDNVYLNNGHIQAAAPTIHVDIPAPHPIGDNGHINAYDTMGSGQNNNAIVNYLNSDIFDSSTFRTWDPGYSPALDAFMANLLNAVKTEVISFNWQIAVHIVYNDGSQRNYSYTYTGGWIPVPKTAIDAHGNPIPEDLGMATNNGIGQNYGFNGSSPYDMGNIENILRSLQAQGIPVHNSNAGTIACVSLGNGKASCTIEPF